MTNYDHFRNATLACSLYDRWLKKYTDTSTSTNKYLDEKRYSKTNGIDEKGRLLDVSKVFYNHHDIILNCI